ncbi:MAG: PKD domain-containing protein, partial [Crocinitomicaceae bacterium]|nr:PKD domain-containing protein [Crocinitomicaceae bacterium]
MRISLWLIFVFCTGTVARSQEMPINGPDIHQCGGFLVDNGLSSSPYTNNQNETITICAQAPETIINLYFSVFDLGSGDYMKIYNGPNTAAPLMGTYYGTDLQSEDVTSSNTSGCLTVLFFADGGGIGNFGAEISCGPPCERPTAIITTGQEPLPVLICPGEPITFDASSSTFAAGQSLQSFQWVFDDGTTNTTSWPTVMHTFPGPGG